MKTNNKGFTLIELLVVIAIIGILSGLIVVSMSGAQGAAKDARIKSELDQIRSVAAIYQALNATYGVNAGVSACAGAGFIAAGSEGDTLCDDMLLQLADGLMVASSATAYCFEKTLNAGGVWCVDSTGYSGTGNACANAHYTCL